MKMRQGVCCSTVANFGFRRYVEQVLKLPLRTGGVSIKNIHCKIQ
jgi:hypothetical protein